MRRRLTREEQAQRNGERLLAAARRVFLANGYAAASLEAIAKAAGFSKGVVYSQFDSKADLFLALLEQRIDERAAQNQGAVVASKAGDSVTSLLELGHRLFESEPAWSLLVVEFRVQAARDPELRRRYARAHARTVEKLAELLAAIHARAGIEPAYPPRTMAELVLAVGAGIELERVNDSEALPFPIVSRMICAALGLPAAGRTTTKEGRR